MPYVMTRRLAGPYTGTNPRRMLARMPRARYLRGLGDSSSGTITPQEAVQQAISQASGDNLNPNISNNFSKWYSQIQAGQFDTSWVSPSCSGIIAKNPDLSLTEAAGSIAGATTGAVGAAAGGFATAAGTALGVATLGIGAVVAVLSIIFAHHAAAVAQEQNLECVATAAANNAMNVLAQGVASGQIAPADAVTALNTLYSQYAAMVKPSWGTSPWCNANCELQILMQAMVLYWQAQYQAMADAQTASSAAAGASPAGAITAPVTGAVDSVAASTGLPTWLIYALGGFLLFELVK